MRSRDNPTTAAVITRVLRAEIIDLVDGTHIGSEENLSRRFDVSSPTIRQAMRILEAEGLVTVRRGNRGGFFASTPSVRVVSSSASALLRRQGAHLGHLIAAAELLGPALAALAAQNPSADDRAGIAQFIDDAWTPGVPVTIDHAAETAIAVANLMGRICGNPALALFADVLADLVADLQPAVTAQIAQPALDHYAQLIRRGHRELAAAIARGDADAARRAQSALNSTVPAPQP
ncbi:FadR/GntR family transcriptional regulator [Nocardia jiangxiensis]|uniref:FadR/GntR family transcriptional regulator n=1 Tax=Nocardia jiangxiensis TaxID=282685 RepID=A0ABW6SCF7_9NOCA|nr:GntR family transcriptional regulator [Nocardia jiangxiensis]